MVNWEVQHYCVNLLTIPSNADCVYRYFRSKMVPGAAMLIGNGALLLKMALIVTLRYVRRSCIGYRLGYIAYYGQIHPSMTST